MQSHVDIHEIGPADQSTFSANQPKIEEIVILKLFDIDGCLHHTFFGEIDTRVQNWLIKNNQEFFSTLINEINEIKKLKPNAKIKLVVGYGTNRQSVRVDELNSSRSASCIPDLPMIQSYLQQQIPDCEVVAEPFWMADIYSGSKAGESYRKALKIYYDPYNNLNEKQADWVFDHHKISLIYAHAHRVAMQNPNAEEIIIDFYDDRLEILGMLRKFYNEYEILLSEKIKLKLHQYGVERIKDTEQYRFIPLISCKDEDVIKGTGEIDKCWAHNILFLANPAVEFISKRPPPDFSFEKFQKIIFTDDYFKTLQEILRKNSSRIVFSAFAKEATILDEHGEPKPTILLKKSNIEKFINHRDQKGLITTLHPCEEATASYTTGEQLKNEILENRTGLKQSKKMPDWSVNLVPKIDELLYVGPQKIQPTINVPEQTQPNNEIMEEMRASPRLSGEILSDSTNETQNANPSNGIKHFGLLFGSTTGFGIGGLIGGAVGFILMPFTLGLSLFIGPAVGVVMGSLVGGLIGHHVDQKLGANAQHFANDRAFQRKWIGVSAGTSVGSFIGGILGTIFAPVTLGVSFVLGPLLGGVIGAGIGASAAAVKNSFDHVAAPQTNISGSSKEILAELESNPEISPSTENLNVDSAMDASKDQLQPNVEAHQDLVNDQVLPKVIGNSIFNSNSNNDLSYEPNRRDGSYHMPKVI